jgi:phage shock protein PspC (stress-responsive transcriptional regulator)
MAVKTAVGHPGGMNEHVNEGQAVKRLERSRSDRMLAGVCGGLASYFDISPAFYRVGFVVLTLLGGAGILIYAAAALVIPEEGKADSTAAEILRNRRERPWPLIGLAILVVAGAVILSRATLWPHGDLAWVLVVLAVVLIGWTQRRDRSAAPPPPSPPPSAPPAAPGEAPSADGPAVASESAVAPKRRGLRRPLAIAATVIAVLVLAGAAAVATVFHVSLGDGVGDRTYQPAGAADVKRNYRLGIGDLKVDLGAVRFGPGETDVDARVGIGELTVTVPSNVALRVDAKTQVGTVDVLGREIDGRNAGIKVNGNGRRLLVLEARVGLGSLHVNRSLP